MVVKYSDTRCPINVELHKPAAAEADHGFQSVPLRETLSFVTILYHPQ